MEKRETMTMSVQNSRIIPSPANVDYVVDRLKKLLVEKVNTELKIEEIDVHVPILEEGLRLDSIMVVDLIVAIEKDFGFNFAENDLSMESFSSLGNLAQLVARRHAMEAA